jgi:hypothetical protein
MSISASMDRSVDPVVARAREVLEPLLERHGYKLTAEYFGPAAFGAVNSEYGSRTHRLELAWDGKDRWLWFKVGRVERDGRRIPLEWQDLESALGLSPNGQRLEIGGVAEGRIQALALALESFFHRAAAI